MNKVQSVIYLAGDSTAAKKLPEKRPEAGWGEYLSNYLKAEIQVENHAMNGRSTKSFLAEKRFLAIEERLQPHDFLFIQFGHNDQKQTDPERYTAPFAEYQSNLALMAEAAYKQGAQPVIFSSVSRRAFLNGHIDKHNLGDYPCAAQKLAEKQHIPFIDLFSLTCDYFNNLGEAGTQGLFLHLQPNVCDNYPEGVADDTHFNEKGAALVAKLAAEELYRQVAALQPYLKIVKKEQIK